MEKSIASRQSAFLPPGTTVALEEIAVKKQEEQNDEVSIIKIGRPTT
jgi:hypothetical protein